MDTNIRPIARGIGETDPCVTVKLFNNSHSDKNDVITEVFRSKGVLFGAPTVNRGIPSAMAGFLELVRGLGFKNKKAAVFGSYGWSGESVQMLTVAMITAGWNICLEGLKTLWMADDVAMQKCVDFGKESCEAMR